jgi:outer membrane protein
MKRLLSLPLLVSISVAAQQTPHSVPEAPVPALTLAQAAGKWVADPNPGSTQASSALGANTTPITRTEAEKRALKNNPRITASELLALAAGQVTREARSNELPQISGNITAVKAEDGSRIGAGTLNSSRLYTHAGSGGTLSQLLTDFGHTRNLVANAHLLEKAQQQTSLAEQQDILFATDQAFYRLLNAQSLLQVAEATVKARNDTRSLTQALTKSALKSDLDLNIAAADFSQAQLLELDARSAVASASAVLAALLDETPAMPFRAVEPDIETPSPPAQNLAQRISEAQAQRPDLQALHLQTQAEHKLALAQQEQHLPTVSAIAVGGLTPVRPDGTFSENWYAAAGVNLSLPLFTGFRINAQSEEARLRERAMAAQAKDLSNAVARDVQVAELTTQTAYQRIGVTGQFQMQATQALRLAQTRYKLGLSSIVELSQAQLEKTQADVAAVNAKYDYLLARRSQDYTEGKIEP